MKLEFPSARGLFITATDTGVGKTIITATLAYHLVQQGRKVAVFKPIATDCILKNHTLVSPDAQFLAHCSGTGQSLDQITPICYTQPLAPLVAAQISDQPIDWDKICRVYRDLVDKYDYLLVEGIGGIRVPLEANYQVIDLIADMGLETLIVARADLGTINHTLLTVEACRVRNLPIAGIIINHSTQNSDNPLAIETNPAVLQQFSGQRILAKVPFDSSTNMEKCSLGQPVMQSLETPAKTLLQE